MGVKRSGPLDVSFVFGPGDRRVVGRVALVRGVAVLEYDEAFLRSPLRLNPLVAPSREPIRASSRTFRGLHGVLGDSLPDAWGEELLRRHAAKHGLAYGELSALHRLAMIGENGPGALAYEPSRADDSFVQSDPLLDIDALATASLALLENRSATYVDELYALAGSSGGARPKITIEIDASGAVRAMRPGARADDAEAWLVKFRGPHDPRDIGLLEAAYADMARDAGIVVSPTRVLEARRGPGYFATRRFDRLPAGRRVHVASVAAILEVDWSVPSIDYDRLLALTRKIAGEPAVEQMFRRMVFNVAAANGDDHTKQHAFWMDDRGEWGLTPAFDLTLSSGPGGERYLAVDGRGREIGRANVLRVARDHGIDRDEAEALLDAVLETVNAFPIYAKRYGVSPTTRALARREQAARAKLLQS